MGGVRPLGSNLLVRRGTAPSPTSCACDLLAHVAGGLSEGQGRGNELDQTLFRKETEFFKGRRI